MLDWFSNSIGAAIHKWHQKLIFLEEDYSIMTEHPPQVNHK
jgi:hypothetical protein